MSAHARKIGTGTRRVTGAALLAPDTVATVKVVCAEPTGCGWTQDEELALDESEKRQLAEVSCGRCGRAGMRRYR